MSGSIKRPREYERNRLEDLFHAHPALLMLFRNEPTIHAWFKQFLHGRCTLEETLIGIIVNLGTEKSKLFDETIKLKQLSSHPSGLSIDKENL